MDVRRVVAAVRRRVFSAAAGATLVALLATSSDVTASGTCAGLRGLKLADDATVSDARTVSSNTKPFFAPRAFCRVFLTIAPTADSDIKAEVWLPIRGWNRKFQAVGNGVPLTHRQMEELATVHAPQFIPGVTDFPKPVAVEAPKVINYLSHGLTAADAVDPVTGIPNSAGIPVPGAEIIPGDPSFGRFPAETMSLATLGELVKSPRPEVAVRPDDQADRFAISSVDATASSTSSDSGLTWDGAMMIGIGTLVVVLALGLGFGFVRRPRIAGL